MKLKRTLSIFTDIVHDHVYALIQNATCEVLHKLSRTLFGCDILDPYFLYRYSNTVHVFQLATDRRGGVMLMRPRYVSRCHLRLSHTNKTLHEYHFLLRLDWLLNKNYEIKQRDMITLLGNKTNMIQQ